MKITKIKEEEDRMRILEKEKKKEIGRAHV